MVKDTKDTKEVKKAGRPKLQVKSIEDSLIDWISEGKTLRTFCRKYKIDRKLVYKWIEEKPAFAVRYNIARQIGCDQIAEQILEIVDVPQYTETTTTQKLKDGTVVNKVERTDNWQSRRLQAEYRMKVLAKFYPEKYGDKNQEPTTSITYNHVLAK